MTNNSDWLLICIVLIHSFFSYLVHKFYHVQFCCTIIDNNCTRLHDGIDLPPRNIIPISESTIRFDISRVRYTFQPLLPKCHYQSTCIAHIISRWPVLPRELRHWSTAWPPQHCRHNVLDYRQTYWSAYSSTTSGILWWTISCTYISSWPLLCLDNNPLICI